MNAGVILLDKPAGCSSFAALGAVKRVLGRRIGHTGTLDPFATGLMVALAGSATRCARYFSGLTKRYEATYRFGSETDTDDSTGSVTSRAPTPDFSSLETALDAFRGTFSQRPPNYSAIHVGGKRAYAIARDGGTPAVPLRTVEVSEHRVVAVRDDEIDVEVACSAGTYIRSLARDLARAMGSRGHVSRLRRTEVGPFAVAEAVSPSEFESTPRLLPLTTALLRLPGFVVCDVVPDAIHLVRNGGRIAADDVVVRRPDAVDRSAAHILIIDDRVAAIGAWTSERFDYHFVVPAENP